MVLGLGLITLVSFFFCLQVAAFAAPMSEGDEAPHASYAAVVAQGRLPTIYTPMPRDPSSFPGAYTAHLGGGSGPRGRIWVANHPPLFYLLGAPVVWLANAVHSQVFALFALRAMNALCTAALALLSGLLARELMPRRPNVILLAAAVTAAMSAVSLLGGTIYNDGLGAALGAWILVLVVRTLRIGLTRRRLLLITALCTALAATRASGLAVVAIAAAGVIAAGLLPGRGTRSWWRAFGPGLLVGGVPAVTVGWFYLRNIALYGDTTASGALLTMFGRQPRPSLLTVDGAAPLLGAQWEWLFVQRRMGGAAAAEWNHLVNLIGMVIAIGIVLGVGFGVARWWRAGRHRPATAVAGVAVAWGLLVIHVIATLATMVQFLAAGGGSHERYLMPIVPTVAAAAAAGIVGLVCWWPRRTRWAAEAVVAAFAGALFLVLAVLLQRAMMQWYRVYQHRPGWHPPFPPAVSSIFGWLGVASAVAALAVLGWDLSRRLRTLPAPTRLESPDPGNATGSPATAVPPATVPPAGPPASGPPAAGPPAPVQPDADPRPTVSDPSHSARLRPVTEGAHTGA